MLVGLLFGGDGSLPPTLLAGVGFVGFCAIASAVYVGNDIFDVGAYRRHPVERERPIASGAIAVVQGIFRFLHLPHRERRGADTARDLLDARFEVHGAIASLFIGNTAKAT